MNRRNPAVKRILADVKELQNHPSSRYFAQPLEDNMFEWHFTIRGPADTPFAEGVYHGRILLPTDYPMKPPNIVFLTKNGRFEVGTKICLSISAYHEETWQPAWGVRTMLEAIISFMPTEGMGAIGALDWTPEERKKLAVESKSFCCSLCGKVADMLSDPKDDIVQSSEAGGEGKKEKEKGQAELLSSQIAQLHMKAAPVSTSPHVQGANSTHMGDFGAESGIKASLGGEMASFGTSNSFDGKSMFHGTNALDTITTTVLAAPLEDSDGLADFLPDLSQRMEQLDNCLDAQDNVDNMGLVEQEDRGMYMSSTRGQGPPPHVHQLPQYEQSVLEGKEERKETHSDDAEGVNSAAASAADVDEPPTHPCDASRYDTGTTLAASELRHRRGGAPAPTPASAVIVSRIDSDRLGTPVSDANSATAARISEDVAMDGSLCEQQCHLSVQYGSSDDKSTLSSVQRTPVSTQDAQEQAQERQDQHQLPQEDPGEEEKGEVDEEERVRQAAAQQEFEQARARLVDRLQGVDRALAAAVERIAQAEDMLVENLEQQGVVGGAGGGAAAGLFRAEEGGGAERDVVDEWLTIVLIALGTSIALMTWRIALRYYSLFFF